MRECVFCSDPTIQKRSIARDELAWAFPTNIPVVPGHVLVAPVRHVERFDELTENERTGVFALMQRLMQALQKSFGAEGFNIAWNQGEVAGQSVPHLHVHLLPRKNGDTGITRYDPREFLYRPGSREMSPEEDLQAVSEEIRSTLEKINT